MNSYISEYLDKHFYKIHQAFSRIVFKFTKKQICTRFPWAKKQEIPTQLTVTETLEGYPIKIFNQGFLSAQIYWIGRFEPNLHNQLTHSLTHLLSSGDLFIDAGANLGYFSVIVGHLLKSPSQQGKVLAFKPCRSTFEILKKNITANSLEQIVDLFPIGLGHKEETKTLHLSDFSELNTFCQPHFSETSTELVSIQPLDSFYNYFSPAYKKCIIKIDVEGFEKELLTGAHKFLCDMRTQHIIIECFAGLDEIKSILNNYGFYINNHPLERATYLASIKG